MNYITPTYKASAFNCPHCQAFAQQQWDGLIHERNYVNGLWISVCEHCNNYGLWIDEQMIFPNQVNLPFPNDDLPYDVKQDFLEARNIANISPRGASALLRLAIQKLCKFLGEKGENINLDIKKLVEKGLSPKIQQSLDIVRVVGNNAVHPGKIDLKDNRELATSLFGLINIIADVMISQPKHIEKLYSNLPENLLASIDNRDNQTQTSEKEKF